MLTSLFRCFKLNVFFVLLSLKMQQSILGWTQTIWDFFSAIYFTRIKPYFSDEEPEQIAIDHNGQPVNVETNKYFKISEIIGTDAFYLLMTDGSNEFHLYPNWNGNIKLRGGFSYSIRTENDFFLFLQRPFHLIEQTTHFDQRVKTDIPKLLKCYCLIPELIHLIWQTSHFDQRAKTDISKS